jgi:heme/copper-type cytochrome/quinol oxidase subunit 2
VKVRFVENAMLNGLLELDAHRVLMLVCLLVIGLVFLLLVGSIFRHRQLNPGASFHRLFVVELMWTLAPLLIVICAVFPAVQTVF